MKYARIFFAGLMLHWCTYSVVNTLSQAGLYSYTTSIAYAPTTGPDNIITITASDITLDLDGLVYSQTNSTAAIDGIVINDNLSNITIKNGIIRGVTNRGIVVGSGCSKIIIDSIVIENAGSRAIDFAGTVANPIISSSINNCVITGCATNAVITTDSVISLSNVNTTKITNCAILNCGKTTNSLSTITLTQCSGCRFQNIEQYTGIGVTTINGFLLNTCTGCFFTNCLVGNYTITTASNMNGFNLNSTNIKNVFINCAVIGNSLSNGQMTGFSSPTTGNDSNYFFGCMVRNNNSNSNAYGFTIPGTGNLFIDCIAQNNVATAGANAYGFYAQASEVGNNYIRCIATDQSGSPAFGFAINSSGSTFTNCISSDQQASGNSAGGFILTSATECHFNECYAVRNQGSSGPNSFGFNLNTGSTTCAFTKNIAIRNGTNTITSGNQFKNFSSTQSQTFTRTLVTSITRPFTNAGLT